MERLVGDAAKAKSGVAADVIVRLMVVVWVTPPPAAVTVTVAVPVVAVLLAERVSVELPLPGAAIEVGLKLAVTPDGTTVNAAGGDATRSPPSSWAATRARSPSSTRAPGRPPRISRSAPTRSPRPSPGKPRPVAGPPPPSRPALTEWVRCWHGFPGCRPAPADGAPLRHKPAGAARDC